MAAVETSTIEFRSNLFPVTEDVILHDRKFLHSLRDPLAIAEFDKRAYRHYPTPLQAEIKSHGVGTKCAYSPQGDLCWGSVLEGGKEKVVCKCENSACWYFPKCRPDAAPLRSSEDASERADQPEQAGEAVVEAIDALPEPEACLPAPIAGVPAEDAPLASDAGKAERQPEGADAECADAGLTWEYDEDCWVLRISGEGVVERSEEWDDLYVDEIRIDEGITAIADEAFACRSDVSRVQLPATLSLIGERAFEECCNLEEVELPEGPLAIGEHAFRCCESLKEIEVPAQAREIGKGAFMGCCRLRRADLSMSALVTLPESAFDGCTVLEEVLLPCSLATIGDEAFRECERLAKLAMPAGSSLRAVGDYAFLDCSSLSSLEFGEGLSEIGESAFQGCASLGEVAFLGSLPKFGYCAFEGCRCTVTYPHDDATWDGRPSKSWNRQIAWAPDVEPDEPGALGQAGDAAEHAIAVDVQEEPAVEEPAWQFVSEIQAEEAAACPDASLVDDAKGGDAARLDAFLNEDATGIEEPQNAGEDHAPCEGVDGRYDGRQAVVVQACPSDRYYVNAGPGSGKTHTLIEKLKYMIEEQGVEPDRITVLSFTRAAVSVIQNRLKAAAARGEIHSVWQDIDVTTFDKLCTRLLYFDADGDKAAEKKISRLGYEPRIVKARALLESRPELLGECEHLVVDETQDLVGARADLVLTMLERIPEECGFTLFGDRCQAIYDYQVKDGGTTPEQFYSEVVSRFAPKQLYLEKNYRQRPSYPLDLADMRASLLDGDANAAGEIIAKAGISLGMPTEPLRKVDAREVGRMLGGGGLGVLTRTNDSALGVESVLWKMGIPSVQGRSDAGDFLSRCVADAFVACDGGTITKDEFNRLSAGHDPYQDGRIWKGLMGVDGIGLSGDRLRIEDALASLKGAVLPAEVAAERENRNAVFVSTVHAAKGREFDFVWMLAEDLAHFAKSKDIEEKRVAYVGLSRGSEDIAVQCLDEHFLVGGKSTFYTKRNAYLDRIYRKRSGARARTGKTKLVNIELKNERDVDFESFRQRGKAQELLRAGQLEGEPLRLVLRGHGERAHYEIVLQSDEDLVLGSMTRAFCDEYKMCADYHNRENVSLPDAFDEVYVDRVITCVGRSTPAAAYDRPFGDMAVWYGFTIGGYAHRDDSQGY